ncbi:MAG: hypothetical protein U0797_31820 [Gemmataceae bacterium]
MFSPKSRVGRGRYLGDPGDVDGELALQRQVEEAVRRGEGARSMTGCGTVWFFT